MVLSGQDGNYPSVTNNSARLWELSSTTRASFQRMAHRHQQSPGCKPAKRYLRRGVMRSPPLASKKSRNSSRDHALVPQQRIQIRLAAPEGFERFQRRPTAPRFQNGLAVQATRFHARRAVVCSCFFKCSVSVSAQYLGPFVAVVTGGVSAGKDVAEGVSSFSVQ